MAKPHLVHGVRVDHRQLLGDVDFERQRQRLGGEGRVVAPVGQDASEGLRQDSRESDGSRPAADRRQSPATAVSAPGAGRPPSG